MKNPQLSDSEKRHLTDFFIFYDEHRMAIDKVLTPICASLLNTNEEEIEKSLEPTARLQRDAVLNDNWIPYLKNLYALGEWYAEGNFLFNEWANLFHRFRSEITDFVLRSGCEDLSRFGSIVLGMDLFLSIVMSPIWDAYSERVQLKEERERLFSAAVEYSNEAILTKDLDGRITSWNNGAARLYGYSADEAIGQPVSIVFPNDKLDELCEILEKVKIGESLDRYETARINKEKKRMFVSLTVSPIKDASGRIFGAAVSADDITERIELEKSLRLQTEELMRSNRELEQFAYVASHDLQEPLRMVASYTELLAERYQGQLDDRADKYIRYMVEGARRMQQLIQDLLTYSRVGTQAKPLVETDANLVARRALSELKLTIEELSAEIIRLELPVVLADESQLQQVFQNLIGNALKFHSDRPIRIRIGADPTEEGWVFYVEDNGIGIESRYSEQIFHMFQRLHHRADYDGNGIGLAIAKKIVERHGGRIWFDSTPDEGTVFRFSIPAQRKGAP